MLSAVGAKGHHASSPRFYHLAAEDSGRLKDKPKYYILIQSGKLQQNVAKQLRDKFRQAWLKQVKADHAGGNYDLDGNVFYGDGDAWDLRGALFALYLRLRVVQTYKRTYTHALLYM
jgi:hypothetical protein